MVGPLRLIPTEPLHRLLCPSTPDNNGAEPHQDSATATTDQDCGGPSNVNDTPHRLCSA
jgi:hypothetical protein